MKNELNSPPPASNGSLGTSALSYSTPCHAKHVVGLHGVE